MQAISTHICTLPPFLEMAAEEALPHGRYSSRTPRAFLDIPTLEQRSLFSSKNSTKSQQRAASDKLVWFSPVHSPLRSPAREKNLQITKKKARPSSIFSIQSRGKASIEAEEPSSPKVSCIGQVRAHRKDNDPFTDALRKKSSQSKPGSMSPARFFASPGRSSKWGSLFSSRKDATATTDRSPGYSESMASRFGLPFEDRTAFQADQTVAVLASSLDLYQEHRDFENCHKNKGMHPSMEASDYPFEKHGICAPADGYIGKKCIDDELDSHADAPSTSSSRIISQKKGACKTSGTVVARESDDSEPCLQASFGNPSQEDSHHEKHLASKQRLTYEELPSLNCGAFTKKNMKISVEVVPETWLWRNGEKLRPDNMSHLSCAPDQSVCTSREDVDNSRQDDINMPSSPCKDTQSYPRDAEECIDLQVFPGQPHIKGSRAMDKHGKPKESFVEVSSNGSSCQPLDAKYEKNGDAEHTLTNKPTAHIAAVKEKSEIFRSSPALHGGAYGLQNIAGFQSGANGAHIGKQQGHYENLKREADVEENRCILGSFDVKAAHQTLRRTGVDVGKENYSIAFPSLLSKEDGKQLQSFVKGRKNEAFSSHPFSAVILVGYDQSSASEDMGCKDEDLLKGILEVGRFSFYGSSNLFQVLNSDAVFNRSRSVTSHRTIIRFQRSNSDPCRSSC